MINTILRNYFEANPTARRRLDRIKESVTKKTGYELPDAEMQDTAKAVFRTLSAAFPEDYIRAELMTDGDGRTLYAFSKAGEKGYIASLGRTKKGLTVLPEMDYESVAHDLERFLGPDDVREKPFEVNAYAACRGIWEESADIFEITGMETAARGVYNALSNQFPNLRMRVMTATNSKKQILYIVSQIGSIQEPRRVLAMIDATVPQITITTPPELESALGLSPQLAASP